MENGLGDHCTLPVIELPIQHWLATDQALKFVGLHRATATDNSLQNFVSGW